MNPAVGPFAIAVVLLTLGGVLKAVRPHDTAVALRVAGVRAGDHAVRLVAAAEAALGVTALVAFGAVPAALVATSYLVFLAFVMLALARRLPIASCGCFGKADTPPSLVHAGVNGMAAAAALAMALDPSTAPLDALTEGLASVAFGLLVVVGVFAAFVALTLLPRTMAAAVGGSPR